LPAEPCVLLKEHLQNAMFFRHYPLR
jgi:hypothetical protein